MPPDQIDNELELVEYILDNYKKYLECHALQFTQVAEAIAEKAGHMEWLDDPEHRVWELPDEIEKTLLEHGLCDEV